MKLYLDMCCYSRLFDEQVQPRVRLEAEAVMVLLKEVFEGRYELITSEIVELENDNNPDIEQRDEIKNFFALAKFRAALEGAEAKRAEDLKRMGFKTYDALHVACAESEGADYFLSTDDNLVVLGLKNKSRLAVGIDNPVDWLRKR